MIWEFHKPLLKSSPVGRTLQCFGSLSAPERGFGVGPHLRNSEALASLFCNVVDVCNYSALSAASSAAAASSSATGASSVSSATGVFLAAIAAAFSSLLFSFSG
jgi:hypothetical protein